MLVNQANLDVKAAASAKSEARIVLTGVNFDSENTTATNAHILLSCELPKVDITEYPAVQGLPEGDAEFSAIVPLNGLKIKKSKNLPILNNAMVVKKEGVVSIATTDLETVQREDIRVVEGSYPPYKQVIPDAEPVAQVFLDPHYLAIIGEYFAKHGADNVVKISLYGESSPVKFEGITPEGQKITGVIMPIYAPRNDTAKKMSE